MRKKQIMVQPKMQESNKMRRVEEKEGLKSIESESKYQSTPFSSFIS